MVRRPAAIGNGPKTDLSQRWLRASLETGESGKWLLRSVDVRGSLQCAQCFHACLACCDFAPVVGAAPSHGPKRRGSASRYVHFQLSLIHISEPTRRTPI